MERDCYRRPASWRRCTRLTCDRSTSTLPRTMSTIQRITSQCCFVLIRSTRCTRCSRSFSCAGNSSEFKRLCPKSLISLCNLCVLCVSVVVFPKQSSTTEAQRTQRTHREEHVNDFSGKATL